MTDKKHQAHLQRLLPMPILTSRLVIRAPRVEEAAEVFHAVQESIDVISRWLIWPSGQKTVADIEKGTRQHLEKWEDLSELHMRVFDRTTGDFIGGSGFCKTDWNVRAFEIGYWVRTSRAGEGLVSEATNAITRWAFGALAANRVVIQADERNLRSRAVAERLGFQLEGILRHNALDVDGKLRNTAVYARINGNGLPDMDVRWGRAP